MIKLPLHQLESYYKNYNNEDTTIDSCKEKGCGLKDIDKKKYLIINGDKVEKSKKNDFTRKSVDCIIIQKSPLNSGGYKIILCELTSGGKNTKDLKEKFKNSGEEISKSFRKFNLKISSFKCVFLGELKNDNRTKRELRKPFNISGLIVNENASVANIIKKYPCNSLSIKNL